MTSSRESPFPTVTTVLIRLPVTHLACEKSISGVSAGLEPIHFAPSNGPPTAATVNAAVKSMQIRIFDGVVRTLMHRVGIFIFSSALIDRRRLDQRR